MNFFDLHCDTATEAMKIHAGLYGSGLQLDLDRWQGGQPVPKLCGIHSGYPAWGTGVAVFCAVQYLLERENS